MLNALRTKLPELRLTIRCGLPRARLALRIEGDFEHIAHASDFGLTMQSALDVDTTASLTRYRALHADWEAQVSDYAQLLAQYRPDWMLVNISYLALAAAARARVPATALCSLNWAEIFYPYCEAAPDATRMREQMLEAYRGAETFLRITPGMEMPGLHHVKQIAPIARQGQNRREHLHRLLALKDNARLTLVAMGGMHLPLSAINWPRHANLFWIVPRDAGLQREDVIFIEDIELEFTDLLASCDCVMTKSGYGTFVEATTAGTPLLYVARPDWPEEPCLDAWLTQHHCAAHSINRAQFEAGDFGAAIWALAAGERCPSIAFNGVAQAAEHLLSRLAVLR